MRTAWTLVTGVASELVSSATAKLQAKIDSTADDSLIAIYVAAARQWVEQMTGYGIGAQTWDYQQETWADEWYLPVAPLTSVASVKYFDASGVEQTLSASVYRVDLASEPGRIELVSGQTWPVLETGRGLPITIRYTAGFTSANVPTPLVQAILILAGHFYDQRAAVEMGTIATKVPFGVESLIATYRAPWREPVAA